MRIRLTVLLLTAVLLLSACSQTKPTSSPADTASGDSTSSQEQKSQQTKVDTEGDTSQGTEPAANAGNDSTPAASTDATSSEISSANDGTAEGNASIPVIYRMNNNYDIVPIDEGTERKVVLLTFDDGPKDRDMITKMLDTLDKHQAKAIFFVNGYRVKENPELLKLIHERGQIIGNHSYDHIVLKNESETKVKQQIEDVQKLVQDTTGVTPVFFRPPHGAGGDVGRKVAKENGLLYMTWSNGSLDWTMKASNSNNPETLIKNVMEQLHAGSNILMHELPWTAEALDTLLTQLEEKGYSFVDPRSIKLEN
ncbi:polysaccharide deacetylase family protein [Paenibacillus massiliensis]|uniref:polysaccharide deacetylase family protein n=1 Tax=Paenibacillus massiliensis TaxID=225917 RepID=UPI00048B4DEB|nr:polysaccharide deacetylase family protein [Paenibacillus massiliensis]